MLTVGGQLGKVANVPILLQKWAMSVGGSNIFDGVEVAPSFRAP